MPGVTSDVLDCSLQHSNSGDVLVLSDSLHAFVLQHLLNVCGSPKLCFTFRGERQAQIRFDDPTLVTCRRDGLDDCFRRVVVPDLLDGLGAIGPRGVQRDLVQEPPFRLADTDFGQCCADPISNGVAGACGPESDGLKFGWLHGSQCVHESDDRTSTKLQVKYSNGPDRP